MADNASITILRNTQANINAEPIKDGNILFTTDQPSNQIYADVGTKRIKIGGTVPIDSTITANSVNPVTSKAIYNEFNNVRGQICTNLLNPTAQTRTINGVTFTNNGDGTYTVNGTANPRASIAIGYIAVNVGDEFRACGASNDVNIGVVYYKSGVFVSYIICTEDRTFQVPDDVDSMSIELAVTVDTTVTNKVIKPMITTDLNAKYDDFVPYTGDSGRLNEDVANLVKGKEISPITNSDIDTILNS